LSSTQRPVPVTGVGLAHFRLNGDGSRGSPNLTIDSENVARACRTRATSPCGEKVCTVAASATLPTSPVSVPANHRAARRALRLGLSPPGPRTAVVPVHAVARIVTPVAFVLSDRRQCSGPVRNVEDRREAAMKCMKAA
jgi:hypothetical protein